MTSEHINHYVYGDKPGPATPIKAQRIADPVRMLLHNHHCTITSMDSTTDILIYPEGATREQLYPVTIDIRYRVKLPDGIEIREIERRHG